MKKLKILIDILLLIFVSVLIYLAIDFYLEKNRVPPSVERFNQMRKGVFSFTFYDQKNKKRSFSELKGKVVLVNLWATWCLPCVEEIPSLIDLAERFPDQLVVLTISQESKKKVKQFFSKFKKPSSNFILGFNEKMLEVFSTQGLPESYLFDKRGMFESKVIGFQEWNQQKWINHIQSLWDQNL